MDVIRPTNALQRRETLRLLMGRPGSTPLELDQQLDTLVRYTEKHGLSLEHCLLAREGGRNLSACLLVDSPGRTSSVFLPMSLQGEAMERATVALLERGAEMARLRDVQLLQGMVSAESPHEATVYRQAGFQRLTQLLYLENDFSEPMPAAPALRSLSWKTYTRENHALFAEVVQGTYEGSFDCGGLNGRRDMEDVLASHRGTGAFDPRFWLIGVCGRDPVGAILLSHAPERWAIEVAYMGLLPDWRSRGFGSALLRRAMEIAREQAILTMTLTVDEQNAPARRLYERFMFREVARREAWIRILS